MRTRTRGRNAEGVLKNMAIHELALLVSFYDAGVDNIESVTADKEFSSLQTLKGPSRKGWTDFDKIKFTIKTKTRTEVSVAVDRCGGERIPTPPCMTAQRNCSSTTCRTKRTSGWWTSSPPSIPRRCPISSHRIGIISR